MTMSKKQLKSLQLEEEERLRKERRDSMVDTLIFFSNKGEEYFKNCTDEQIAEEYDRLTLRDHK